MAGRTRNIKRCALAGVGTVLLLFLIRLAEPPSLYGARPFSTAVFDRDGELLRLTLAADDRYRLKIPLEEISPALIEATLAYEDRWFFRHPGVNPIALGRAAAATWLTDGRAYGASTITMQLVRLRDSLPTRTPAGKLVQIAKALHLEWHYDKTEILEAYLNLAPYGGNIEGAGAAARAYFGKPAAHLSAGEAAALAAIPQSPKNRNPAVAANRTALERARQRVIANWQHYGSLGANRAAGAKLPVRYLSPSDLPRRAPHAARALGGNDGDQRVRASLSLRTQTAAAETLRRYVERRRRDGIRNAAALVVDSRSMAVLASIGSVDFADAGISGQVDGTRASRSPGSTLKPLLYAMALDRGLIHPATLLKDTPMRSGIYTPENYDRRFIGPVLAADALIYSRNVPALRLLREIGTEDFHRLLTQANVAGLRPASHYGLSIILGGGEISMRELAGLYAMLANGGVWQPLNDRADPASPGEANRLLSPEAAFLTLNMLTGNPQPAAADPAGAFDRAPPVAWKTGTSYGYRDAWAIGVSGHIVVAVWIGNFDGSSNPAFVGREAAGPLLFELLGAIGQTGDEDTLLHPDPSLNLARVEVCKATGDLPGAHCPATTTGWFIPGVSPIRASVIHQEILVDADTGWRLCNNTGNDAVRDVHAFWPPDIVASFATAGIQLALPPAWAPECDSETRAGRQDAPQIRSPAAGVRYVADLFDGRATVPLAADAAAAEVLHWFADDRYIASTNQGETFLWRPARGEFDVAAVDDKGSAAAVSVRIW